MDAANVVTLGRGSPRRDELSERDQRILAFERLWWKYAGAKEQAVREQFAMSATRYYQVLNALIDQPEPRSPSTRSSSSGSVGSGPLGSGSAPPAGWASRSDVALPSVVTLGSLAFVLAAGVGYAAISTASADTDQHVARSAHSPGLPVADQADHHPAPRLEHADHSTTEYGRGPDGTGRPLQQPGVTGVAEEQAAMLESAGWNVVATDNWYGKIPAEHHLLPATAEGGCGQAREGPGHQPAASGRRADAVRPLTVIFSGG